MISNSDWNRALGSNVLKLRVARGMSQTDLGKGLGISFQQVQKYEKGYNRISVERLWDMSRVLNVPLTDFFEGMDTPHQTVTVAPPEHSVLELSRVYRQLSERSQSFLRRTAYSMLAWESHDRELQDAAS